MTAQAILPTLRIRALTVGRSASKIEVVLRRLGFAQG